MSKKLLAMAIGPVQEFIASARRTRDLWFGSHMLSAISKAIAFEVYHSGGQLIFPAPERPEDLQPKSQLLVANKLLAVIPGDQDIELVISSARRAAEDRLLEFARDALHQLEIERLSDLVVQDRFYEQLDDLLEIYSAWVPLTDDYAAARNRVERLLAGRKALRDFKAANGVHGVPKSSLDGARESVLQPRRGKHIRGIKENEQLDAVGLIKRFAGNQDFSKQLDQLEASSRATFPPVAQVALSPWLRGIEKSGNSIALEGLQVIQTLCKNVLSRIDTRVYPQFAFFPYDASILLESRVESIVAEEISNKEIAKQLFDSVRTHLKELYKQFGVPVPYLAFLIADGDKMGAAISSIASVDRHQKFSRQLSQFAGQARQIVQRHHGVCVYSGGDDVMAFLPIDTCLVAARELHEVFGNLMSEFHTDDGSTPTLSVGIGIGHCLEPMEDLLELARKAEKIAKQGDGNLPKQMERDGLCLLYESRSGGSQIHVRGRWADRYDADLRHWIDLILNEEISDKSAYDVRRVATYYETWPSEAVSPELLQADTKRVLKKKRADNGGRPFSEETINSLLVRVQDVKSLRQLAEELLIAAHLAPAFRQSREPKAPVLQEATDK